MIMRPTLSIFLLLLSSTTGAQNPVIRIADDLEAVPLSPSTYIHKSYHELPNWGRVGANGLVYVSGGDAVIVDTPWTCDQTDALIDWIEDSLHATVTKVAVTHWHNDCMGGLDAVIERSVASYACEKTREIAASKSLPVPQTGFADTLSLSVGETKVVCAFPGGGHTIDNIVVYVPGENILFGGCLLKALGSRSLGSIVDADLDEWPVTVRKLIKRYSGCTIVIPRHGLHGDMSLAVHTLELLEKNSSR